jgi:hypothetical protein
MTFLTIRPHTRDARVTLRLHFTCDTERQYQPDGRDRESKAGHR